MPKLEGNSYKRRKGVNPHANRKITQVMGPVVDVHFDETPLPYIQTALQVDNHGKKL